MIIFKCKMCGGSLEITENTSVCTCEYCGTDQTIPRLNTDKKVRLYDRANHFRRNNDFDKAMSVYEQILNEDGTDAESYWSLVLCRYGIEYVEDPQSHKRVPTVNRAQYTSIFADEDYKAAIQNADDLQKTIYEEEAKVIDSIQKNILSISEKEEPFDVFICYKETDENGRRTPDSVLANDLYHQLVQENLKVFFSRITLEDKLGQEYEPYIFAALNSAKVMVVLGTKPSYFNAVWVKNEWSRYMGLIQNGARKILIPAYKDMTPYDLPEEFSHLQAQDMTKLGFMQDLLRGIKKVVAGDEKHSHDTRQNGFVTDNYSALIERGYLALEDEEWEKADAFFEEVLNKDARNAQCYLGKYMASEHAANLEKLKKILAGKYITATNDKATAVNDMDVIMKNAVSKYRVPGYLEQEDICGLFEFDNSYRTNVLCRKKQKQVQLLELKNNKLLSKAERYADDSTKKIINNIIHDIRITLDSRIQIAEKEENELRVKVQEKYAIFLKQTDEKLKEMYEQAKDKKEKTERKIALVKKCLLFFAGLVVIGFICTIIVIRLIIPYYKYYKAVELAETGKYVEALEAFSDVEGYKLTNEYVCKAEISIIREAKTGEQVSFGEDNNWIIIEKNDKKAALISKNVVARKPYSSRNSQFVWEDSSLREWLNTTYIDETFSEAEKEKLISVNHQDEHADEVLDKVYILSMAEAEQLLKSTNLLKAENDMGKNENWWLRTKGTLEDTVSFVRSDGTISIIGANGDGWNGVRPVISLSLAEE